MDTRKARFKGLPIVLRVGEYEQLLRRFDPEGYDLYYNAVSGDNIIVNIKEDYDTKRLFYATEVSCPLCAKHMYATPACTKCTFNKFGQVKIKAKFGKYAGCNNVINILLSKAGFKEYQILYMGLNEYSIRFDYVVKEVCFKQLKVLYDWLKIAFST